MTDISDNKLTNDPATLSPRELDKLFWNAKGKGEGTLVIGGIEVTKRIYGHSSNSGKSIVAWDIAFSWVNPQGQAVVVKEDVICNNQWHRRNY